MESDPETRATSFGRAADDYRRARPGYPDEVVRWLVPPGASRVLDLAAGTGKLTERLLELDVEVVAVEPDASMLEELQREAPTVQALEGRAEAIPLEDAAVDVVVVAQAWHWFDPATVVPEVARVLRPGGTLAVVANVRDDAVDWVARYSEILGRGDAPPPVDAEPVLDDRFGPLETLEVEWSQTMTVDDLVTLAASRSNVLAMDDAERTRLLGDVERLARTHPDTAGRDTVELPYRTKAWRAALR